MSSESGAQPLPHSFTIDSSEKINELVEALGLAQGKFPVIAKDSEVRVYSKPPERKFLYSYMYADLTAIIDATRPALNDNGLSFTQDYTKHPALGVGICTILFHKSGQWLKTGFVPCSIQGMDMKGIAGQFTYGKRISLTAALGVSGDEDVDAASIEGQQGNQTEKTPPKKSKAPIKNHAPGAENPPHQREKRKVDELVAIVREAGIKDLLVPQIIQQVVGEKRKATELAPIEIDQVVTHIRDTYLRSK